MNNEYLNQQYETNLRFREFVVGLYTSKLYDLKRLKEMDRETYQLAIFVLDEIYPRLVFDKIH